MMIYTTADAVAARLAGQALTPEQEQIPLMEEHGFVVEYRSASDIRDIRFVRGRLHVWRIFKNKRVMWQTAILKNGYYIEHIPIHTLEHVCKSYSHERNIRL